MYKTLRAIGFWGLFTILTPLAAAAQQDIALVYKLMNDASAIVTPAAAAQPLHPARLGELLRGGDLIVTSSNTRAAIRFTDDGSILRLNPSSKLQVRAEGDRNNITKTLELEFGELWAKVNHREGSQFRVQTPAGVAAVKGTEFIVRVDENGATSILTLQGVVEFFNRGGTTEVRGGRRTQVSNQDQAPTSQATREEDLAPYKALINEEGGAGSKEEGVEIEVLLQDANGQTRSVIMVVPRRALRSLLEGGK